MTEEIIQAIDRIPSRVVGHGNRAWTQAVKNSFIELGKKHKWGVCASSSEPEVEPEWLYDLCWYARSENEEFEVGLILESEWSQDYYDLRFDFEKLLCARSPFKVFIFEACEAAIEQNFTALKNAIQKSKFGMTGETYVLSAFQPELSKRKFRTEIIK